MNWPEAVERIVTGLVILGAILALFTTFWEGIAWRGKEPPKE